MTEAKSKLVTRVLVVDPDRQNLERMVQPLREAGLQIFALSRLEVAPPLYEVVRPDAAVIACRLPDAAAISAARRLRQLSKGALPLLYVVDGPDQQARQYLLERAKGADVLVQPVDARELVAKILAQVRLKRSIEKIAKESGATAPYAGLSGVVNRTLFTAMIEHEARRAERHGGSFAVLVGLIKELEQLKRTSGSECADRAAAHASQILRSNTRECDVLCKLGEAEFALCLPGASREGLPFLRHRLRSSFDASPLRLEGRVLRLSVAIGAASFPEAVSSARRMLRVAYQDLRRPKGFVRASGASWLTV